MYRHKWKARRGSEPELHVHVHIYRTCACLQLVLLSVSSSLMIVIWVQTLVLTWNATLTLSLLLSQSLTLYTQNTFYLCLHIAHSRLSICEVHRKTSRQKSLFDHLLYWLHIAWAHCHHYETEFTISGLRRSNGTRLSPDFSPWLWDQVYKWLTFACIGTMVLFNAVVTWCICYRNITWNWYSGKVCS